MSLPHVQRIFRAIRAARDCPELFVTSVTRVKLP